MRTQQFLDNMLPPQVLHMIKQGNIVAHQYHGADVIFCDIVSFTSIASSIPAEDVVAVLNVMFSTYDALSTQHSVYKVETIGDCWMGCCGVVSHEVTTHRTWWTSLSPCRSPLEASVYRPSATGRPQPPHPPPTERGSERLQWISPESPVAAQPAGRGEDGPSAHSFLHLIPDRRSEDFLSGPPHTASPSPYTCGGRGTCGTRGSP